jgi:hypothetical protein
LYFEFDIEILTFAKNNLMKFYQRFAYYLVGFIMGCFVVALVLSGKDTRCNYFPNARVLSSLRSKSFEYSDNSTKILNQGWVTIEDVKNILTYGDIDFDKSNLRYKKGKLYIVEGQTKSKQKITLKVINYDQRAVLDDIIKN